jgi:hypothetical protein
MKGMIDQRAPGVLCVDLFSFVRGFAFDLAV